MNDPKPFFHVGECHVFHRYGPAGNRRLKHRGHVRRRDLVRWEHLPAALTPTPGGSDQNGCYTGCVVQEGEKTHVVYTGVSPQVQCLAPSTARVYPAHNQVGVGLVSVGGRAAVPTMDVRRMKPIA